MIKMSFRWYGESDPVKLANVRQVPGMHGIVGALFDVPLEEAWPKEKIQALKSSITQHGFAFEVVESIGVHEDVKLGKPTRDRLIDAYCETVERLAAVGVKVVCYNFMPVFNWMRTDLERPLPDGSTSVAFNIEELKKIDFSGGVSLPAWDITDPAELRRLANEYASVSEDQLRANLEYFLKRVIPVAARMGIKMAIHPDDPPRPIFGLPRIVKNREDLRRILDMVPENTNGLTFCTGSLGADLKNDLPAMVREFSGEKRIHFAHMRNVKTDAEGNFQEVAHLSSAGSVDMAGVVRAYQDTGFDGYVRPDHGRMIWGERGIWGYGLYDRSLGAVYLNGLWEATERYSQSVKRLNAGN